MLEKVKMEAEASENSTVQQAGRDIYNGPTLLQIIETIDYQIEKRVPELLLIHGPQLLEAENQKVQVEIQEFKQGINSMLESKLASNNNSDEHAIKILSKVTDANFQYLFHEGLKNVIRRKESSSKEILIELLSKKLDTDEADDSSYILDDAIETLSNLSKNQINFLGFINGIRKLSYSTNWKGEVYNSFDIVDSGHRKGLSQEEINVLQEHSNKFYLTWLNLLIDHFTSSSPSQIDVDYLVSKGVLFTETKSFTLTNGNIILRNLYGTENFNDREKDINVLVPKMYELIKIYGLDSIDKLPAFSSKGTIIGEIIFQKWLKTPH
jgi:hypothetical protein